MNICRGRDYNAPKSASPLLSKAQWLPPRVSVAPIEQKVAGEEKK